MFLIQFMTRFTKSVYKALQCVAMPLRSAWHFHQLSIYRHVLAFWHVLHEVGALGQQCAHVPCMSICYFWNIVKEGKLMAKLGHESSVHVVGL